MITEIDFLPRLAAEILLSEERDAASRVVISISDPGEAHPLQFWAGQILRLAFTDHQSLADASERAFSVEQARQIVEFIRGHHAQSRPVELVVHCEGGVSRSAAVALYARSLTGAQMLRFDEADAANPRILELLLTADPAVGTIAKPAVRPLAGNYF